MLKLPRQLLAYPAGLVLLLATQLAVAGDLPTSKPERQGMASDRLQRLTDFMNDAVDRGIMVGGQGMIARDGRVVYNEVYGMRDREQAEPTAEDDIYRIYSMTKPIAGVALMMLHEQGLFFLDEPVARYIPELANLQVSIASAATGHVGLSDGTTSAGAEVEADSDKSQLRPAQRQPTIRDLLRHTAGFSYGIFGNTPVDQGYVKSELLIQPDLQQFVQVLGQQPLLDDPGNRWHYSVSVDVQGRLVEVLSGMSFGEFLQKRVFEPLGMVDTSFILPENKRDRLMQLYSPIGSSMNWETGFKLGASQQLEVADPEISRQYLEGGVFESGGGGLLSTAADYIRFCLMMVNGGELNGTRLLSPKTVELMSRDHLGGIPAFFGRPGESFGLGFAVVEDVGQSGSLESDGNYYWGGAAGTGFWIDPEEGMVGVFMTQSVPHMTQLRSRFRLLTYQALID